MRTLIISDLHLGNGGPYDAFAGERELPALLDRLASPPTRVLVNGDGIDFLTNDDPLELDVERAVAQARGIVGSRASAAVFAAFGRVLAAGGEVVIRLGNHDVELALPEVQEVLRGALGQPAAVAARLSFQNGEAPGILEIGGARVLVTHGEHTDPWNQVDYAHLKAGAGFKFAPGSVLVKQILNRATKDLGMRFATMLKPDFQGAALTALAVNPSALKLVFQEASFSIAWQLFRKAGAGAYFLESAEEETNLGLAERLDEAGLSAAELEEVEGLLDDAPMAFAAGDDDGLVSRARIKIARAGIGLYAKMQRRLAGTAGDTYFELEPGEDEWKEARRLAQKYGAGAVIIGHTHAARWKEEPGLVFANTGTWIWLMQLPRSDAGDDVWAEFLTELRQNPGMAPDQQKVARLIGRFTAVLAEEHAEGGASISLVELDAGGELRTLARSRVAAAAG